MVRTITRADVYALWGGITAANGASASLDVAADGSQAFVAVDRDSGETLWSTPLLGPNAARAASLENSFGGGCQSDAGPDEVATVAVCLVTDGFTRYATAEDSPGATSACRRRPPVRWCSTRATGGCCPSVPSTPTRTSPC